VETGKSQWERPDDFGKECMVSASQFLMQFLNFVSRPFCVILFRWRAIEKCDFACFKVALYFRINTVFVVIGVGFPAISPVKYLLLCNSYLKLDTVSCCNIISVTKKRNEIRKLLYLME
jgi:hypothetical protein